MKATLTVAWLLIMTTALAQGAVPIRQGSGGCPAGYVASGSFCTPVNRDARICVERRHGASCPATYLVSGSFCFRSGTGR